MTMSYTEEQEDPGQILADAQNTGWPLVQSATLADITQQSPDEQFQVESLTFQVQSGVFDVAGWFGTSGAQQIQDAIQQQGSNLYMYWLYQNPTPLQNIQIPQSFTIPTSIFGIPVPGGGNTISIPGGGTTLLEVDEYLLVGIHSQVWAVLLVVFVAISGIAFLNWVIDHKVSPLVGVTDILNALGQDTGKVVGAPTQGATNTLLLFTLAGVALAIVIAELNKTSGLGLSQPSTPSLTPPAVTVSGKGGPVSATVSNAGGGAGGARRQNR